MLGLPNLPHVDVAIGKSADDNRKFAAGEDRQEFDFPAKSLGRSAS
jgi:hypothetical protein